LRGDGISGRKAASGTNSSAMGSQVWMRRSRQPRGSSVQPICWTMTSKVAWSRSRSASAGTPRRTTTMRSGRTSSPSSVVPSGMADQMPCARSSAVGPARSAASSPSGSGPAAPTSMGLSTQTGPCSLQKQTDEGSPSPGREGGWGVRLTESPSSPAEEEVGSSAASAPSASSAIAIAIPMRTIRRPISVASSHPRY